MRKTTIVIGLMLGLLLLAACSVAGLPTPQAPTPQEPASPLPAAPLPADYVGVYTASLPAADSPAREVTVSLEADGVVTVTSDFLNDQPPLVETGSWSANPSGTITMVLTQQGDRRYFEPRSYLVGLEGDELLVLTDGGAVVRFARATGQQAAEPPAAAPSSEEAPAATAPITVTETVSVTAPLTVTAAITEEVTLANTYLALRPAASAGGAQLIALSLFQDGRAQLATEFASKEEPIVELGTWVDNGDDTITLTLTGRADREYEAPVVITFRREDEFLQSIGSEELLGSEGLRLRQAAKVARTVKASLVTLDLEAGFPLDPTFVSVQAGGEVDASLLTSQCSGFIHREPVATINWQGSAPYASIFFMSDSDPTLVVLTPDGQLLCNDDWHKDILDPAIELVDPPPGVYRVWVGSYSKGQLIPGVLALTTKPDVNLGAFSLNGLIRRPPTPKAAEPLDRETARAAGIQGILDMAAEVVEFSGDEPLSASLTISGAIPLFQLGLPNPTCNGLVSGAPDFVFDWTGDGDTFTLFFEGDRDATLLVLSEDGELLACGDDAEFDANLNPVVTVSGAKPGLFGVWVGRIDPSRPVVGTLTITTATDAAPRKLAPIQ